MLDTLIHSNQFFVLSLSCQLLRLQILCNDALNVFVKFALFRFFRLLLLALKLSEVHLVILLNLTHIPQNPFLDIFVVGSLAWSLLTVVMVLDLGFCKGH